MRMMVMAELNPDPNARVVGFRAGGPDRLCKLACSELPGPERWFLFLVFLSFFWGGEVGIP